MEDVRTQGRGGREVLGAVERLFGVLVVLFVGVVFQPVAGEDGEVREVDSCVFVQVCSLAELRGCAGVQPAVGEEGEVGGVC